VRSGAISEDGDAPVQVRGTTVERVS
jgi:hypothetical protein